MRIIIESMYGQYAYGYVIEKPDKKGCSKVHNVCIDITNLPEINSLKKKLEELILNKSDRIKSDFISAGYYSGFQPEYITTFKGDD